MNNIKDIELRDYQQHIYPVLYETLSKRDYCVLVTTTGTGKSYLTIQYLLDLRRDYLNVNKNYKFKFLLIVPTHVIRKGWEKNLKYVNIPESMFEIVTYVTFVNRCNRNYDFSDYNCFIFDEVHHAGSETRNDVIYRFIHNQKGKKIGLTADPVRYSDSGRDVSLILFDGNIVYGYNLSQAIKLRILPKFKYCCGVLGVHESVKRYKKLIGKRVDPNLLARLNLALQNQGTVSDILHRGMPDGIRKGIVFCSDINDIPKCYEFIKDAYPNAKYFIVNSKRSRKVNNQVMERFDACKTDCYLFSVNMVNEGIHLHDINTLIMFRKTSVPTVFFQQIGRAMSGQDIGYYSFSDDHGIVVFDFVCNSIKLRYSDAFIKDNVQEEGASSKNKKIDIEKNPFTLEDSIVLNILNVLDEIRYSLDDTWTTDEKNIIKQYYRTEQQAIVDRLPNRSWKAIKVQASRMNIQIEQPWTDKEKEILKQNLDKSLQELHDLLPYERTIEAISKKKQELGLSKSKKVWTPAETQFLKENYNNGIDFLLQSVELERWDEPSIRTKAKKLGLRLATMPWTDLEKKDLLQNYGFVSKEELCKKLNNRTWNSIKSQYNRMMREDERSA